jgi:hypothetical protein
VKVVVSRYVPDNQIVLRRLKPRQSPGVFASYFMSVWNLETGEIGGDCMPEDATEWHMSAKRFRQLKKMIDDYDEQMVKRQK